MTATSTPAYAAPLVSMLQVKSLSSVVSAEGAAVFISVSFLLYGRVRTTNIIAHIYKKSNVSYTSADEENTSRDTVS